MPEFSSAEFERLLLKREKELTLHETPQIQEGKSEGYSSKKRSLPVLGSSQPLAGTKAGMSSHARRARFNSLCALVQKCTACPAMNQGQRRVLSSRNGPPSASVMFIAEAPGRNGADRTGIPIYGDPTGYNFEELLNSIGWYRSEVFITNCVLCNPRDGKGNNRTPNVLELGNCSHHLESTIHVVDPVLIVTLGASPLAALSYIRPHKLVLNKHVAKPILWMDRILYPLYHPSPRALVHRSMAQQKVDFLRLSQIHRRLVMDNAAQGVNGRYP